MPLPLIAAIASLAATGTGLGFELANQPGGGGTAAPNPAAVPGYLSAGEQTSDISSIVTNIKELLGSTMGSLNPASYGATAATEAGIPQQTGLTLQAILEALGQQGITPSAVGGTETPPTGGTASPTAASALLSRLRGYLPTPPGLSLQSPF